MKILNRAKAIDGTGGYIVSQSVKFENEKMFLYSIPFRQWVECEESTRALNFEDMLDSQGSKIFASLSEDGKGGDMLKNDEYEFVAKYSDCGIILKSKSGELFMGAEYIEINNLKVTGIQK